MNQFRMKRGSTFQLIAQGIGPDALPINMAACTLSVAAKTALGVAVSGLSLVAVPGTPGAALLLAQASDTAAWPLGGLRADMKFVSADGTQFSDTILILVEEAISA